MNKEMTAKINKIAMNIAMGHNSKVAYSMQLNKKTGVEHIAVNSVKIIVKLDGLKKKSTDKVAEKKRKQVTHDVNGPQYELNDLKAILSSETPNVEFKQRHRAQPERNLNITRTDAINILKSLQPSEYKSTARVVGAQSADEYVVVRKVLGEDTKIYIKFYIKNKTGIFVISFHESYR